MALKRTAVALLGSLWLVSVPLHSAIENLRAVRVDNGPRLDGTLDDECWARAVPFVDFLQQQPVPSGRPSERTELRVVYDQDSLYIGLVCFDSEPAKIAAMCMAHDRFQPYRGVDDDVVRVLLDPFQDRRNAYIFIANACGARSEGLARGERYSLSWDGIWDAASAVFDGGWSVEMRIPFKTISFNSALSAWGLNVERYIARKQETIRLSRPEINAFFGNPANAALLQGVSGVRQGLGLTFRPFGKLSLSSLPEEDGTQWKIDGGFDVFKNFTSNLVGAFSYNTDFAETEVDERRINLTRFSLYFPEKRTFFLEGSEYFSFGSVGGGGMGGPSFIPFFSRRIGLVEEEQIPVAFGAKVYGKVGRTSLAVMDVRTRPFSGDLVDLSAENFLAARVSQNIFDESKVGVIFTSGIPTNANDPATAGPNTLAGIDFDFTTSRFLGDRNFSAQGWAVYNWNPREDGKHHGFGFRLDYPNDLWDISANYSYYGDALEPGLGFLPRNAVQVLSGGLSYKPRPEKGVLGRWIRQLFFELRPSFYWDLTGFLETSRIFVAPLNLRTEGGSHIEFNFSVNRDVLPEGFEISEGIIIPPGPYEFTNYNVQYSSPSYGSLILGGEVRFGPFYSGTYRDAQINVSFRLNGHFNLGLSSNFVKGNLREGAFTENVLQLKADVFVSPDLGLMNIIQYDDVSRTLGANVRFRWQISPGNVIYLVYNSIWEREIDPGRRFLRLESGGVFKITLSIRP